MSNRADTTRSDNVLVSDLGLIDYDLAYALQQEAVGEVIEGGAQKLLLCEHSPVFTLGRLGSQDNFLTARALIEDRGVPVVRVDRGGEVTVHAPGQLVAYPVLDLNRQGKDLRKYLYRLEQVAIDFLAEFDIVASRISGKTGVFVNDKKIASIGIGVKKWVSFHGMAININTDLQWFSMIRPCGLDISMTSLSLLQGKDVDCCSIKDLFVQTFQRVFAVRIEFGVNRCKAMPTATQQ